MRLRLLLTYFFAFLALTFSALLPRVASAQDDTQSFKTDATSTYSVQSTGSTRVEHRFTVTNLKPTTYLKQYSIRLQFPSVTEITATNQGESITPYVVKDGPTTSITLNFDGDVVGEGKTRVFTISYTTKDVATGSGSVLDVRIPAFSGATENQHTVYLTIPSSYGQPVRENPKPSKESVLGGSLQLEYQRFPAEGIAVLFGNEQTYSLKTRYLLQNPSTSTGFTQIALPPDTSYQRMEYEVLDPRPDSMKIDEDGNWTATYTVPASDQLEVNVQARVKVTLEPDTSVPVVAPTSVHTAELPFWQKSSPSITELAKSGSLHNIYLETIKALSYDTERVAAGDITTRLGAEQALANPENAVCQEYADVLIAGWRSAGIPARRLNGYAISQNEEIRPSSFQGTVLHAWVDYYDQAAGLWRMVDPTWEDTTGGVNYFSEFDLNHIVLSINGASSSEPAPAGSYINVPEEAQLTVTVVNATESAAPSFTAVVEPTTAFGIKIPGSHTVTITNETGRAWYDTHVSLSADKGIAVSGATQSTSFLPFEKKTVATTLNTPLTSGWSPTTLTIQIATSEASEPYVIKKENLTAGPALVTSLATVNPSTPLGVAAILCFLTAGSLLVFRRKRKAPVRRKSKKPQEAPQQLPPTAQTLPANPPDGRDGSDGPVA